MYPAKTGSSEPHFLNHTGDMLVSRECMSDLHSSQLTHTVAGWKMEHLKM